MKREDRTPVSVNPERVDCTTFFCGPTPGNDVSEALPAATKIIMRNKQEYLVQGAHDDVVLTLNTACALIKDEGKAS